MDNILAPTKFLLFNILNRVASSARVISYLIFLVVALLLQGVGRLSERAGNQPELVDLVSKRVNARLKSADPLSKIVVVPKASVHIQGEPTGRRGLMPPTTAVCSTRGAVRSSGGVA